MTEKTKELFDGWQETLIWSCLQSVMGEIYADDPEYPQSAKAVLGDFCFFAGLPQRELILHKPLTCVRKFMIMVPQNDEWAQLIGECYGARARKVIRWAFLKEPDAFDDARLRQLVNSLPSEYSLELIGEELYGQCRSRDWSRDLVGLFDNYEMYRRLGIGVAVTVGGTLVSAASSYARYREGIEIEIDTKEEYRRKGLASACAAQLILECRKRGLYPSWDAQNPWSAALAEKLGYHRAGEYTAFEIDPY